MQQVVKGEKRKVKRGAYHPFHLSLFTLTLSPAAYPTLRLAAGVSAILLVAFWRVPRLREVD